MWDREAYLKLVSTLGVKASLHYTKTPATVLSNIIVGFASVSKENEVLVNALGASAKVITILARDAVRAPVKFDSVHVGNEKYVIDSVNPVHLPGTDTVISYRCFCKGLG